MLELSNPICTRQTDHLAPASECRELTKQNKSLQQIEADIPRHKALLDQIDAARQQMRGYTAVPLEQRGFAPAPVRLMWAATGTEPSVC